MVYTLRIKKGDFLDDLDSPKFTLLWQHKDNGHAKLRGLRSTLNILN